MTLTCTCIIIQYNGNSYVYLYTLHTILLYEMVNLLHNKVKRPMGLYESRRCALIVYGNGLSPHSQTSIGLVIYMLYVCTCMLS